MRQPRVGKTHRLQPADTRCIGRQAIRPDNRFRLNNLANTGEEPRVVAGDPVDLRVAEPLPHRLGRDQQPVGRRLGQFGSDHIMVRPNQRLDLIKPAEPSLQTAQRLLHAFGKAPPNRHHLANRLHRRGQQGGRALELLERKARDFGDDIVDGRLERGWRCARNVIGDFVERIANRQLGRDLGNREAGGLGGECGGPRHARIHLDNDQPPVLRIDGELDVGTPCFNTDFTQASDACVAHDLIFLVGQRQRRGDGDRVPGVNPHRVDILNGTDDDGIVVAVPHDLHLIFFPAEQRLLDQHFGRRRGIEPAGDDLDKFVAVIGDAAAGAAHSEGRPDDGGKPGPLQHSQRLRQRMGNARPRRFQPDLGHRFPEFHPVLGLVDRLGIGADHLHAIFRQRAIVEQRQRGVERGLPAHRRQHSVGPLLLDDARDDRRRDRLDIGRIGHVRIGHDRRGVGVHQDDPVTLLAQRLARLRPRIIELARLPDDDGASADDQDGGDVGAFGHLLLFRLICFVADESHFQGHVGLLQFAKSTIDVFVLCISRREDVKFVDTLKLKHRFRQAAAFSDSFQRSQSLRLADTRFLFHGTASQSGRSN